MRKTVIALLIMSGLYASASGGILMYAFPESNDPGAVAEPLRASDLFAPSALQPEAHGDTAGLLYDALANCRLIVEQDWTYAADRTFVSGLYADLKYAAEVSRCIRQVRGNRTLHVLRVITAG